MATPTYSVVARNNSGYRTEIVSGAHTVIADEPLSFGGTDQGPNPYDLLVTALGGCMAITLRMYAERKEWPLENIGVRLEHHCTHGADEQVCETEPVKLDQIDVRLELGGPLSDEQRARLHEIAGKCPIHRTLSPCVQVHILQ